MGTDGWEMYDLNLASLKDPLGRLREGKVENFEEAVICGKK